MKYTYIALSLITFLVIGLIFRERIRPTYDIVCTTSMIGDAVATIVGDKYTVKTLMGPGIDPHLYRAKESDVHILSNAKLIVYNGLHLEGKLVEILERIHHYIQTICICDGMDKRKFIESDFDAIYDPHVWHDVSLWIQAVEHIVQCLIQFDAENTTYYRTRADAYIQDLEQLHTYVHARVSTLPKKRRKLVTAHDAFAYFGKAYGIDVVGLQGISTDAQVGSKDIETIATYAVEHNVPAIFLEASIPERSIKAVQRAVQARGHEVSIGPELFSDSLGDSSTTSNTYRGMIMYNVDAIVSALY